MESFDGEEMVGTDVEPEIFRPRRDVEDGTELDPRHAGGDVEGPTGFMTEFQSPRTFKIELKPFINELDLANFLFTTGELYFINKNFVS